MYEQSSRNISISLIHLLFFLDLRYLQRNLQCSLDRALRILGVEAVVYLSKCWDYVSLNAEGDGVIYNLGLQLVDSL